MTTAEFSPPATAAAASALPVTTPTPYFPVNSSRRFSRGWLAVILVASTSSFRSKPAIIDSPITPQPIKARCIFFRSCAIDHLFVKRCPFGQNIDLTTDDHRRTTRISQERHGRPDTRGGPAQEARTRRKDRQTAARKARR